MISHYLRMEEIDDTEDIGFYVPGAGEFDAAQRKLIATLHTRALRAELENDIFLEAIEDEWN